MVGIGGEDFGSGYYGIGGNYEKYVEGTILEKLPFLHPRGEPDLIRKYIEAHDEELIAFDTNLTEVIASYQIDQATGEQLDRLGALYGKLGLRNGRNDSDYRSYLKSIQSSLTGAGTVPDIKFAVGGGVGEGPDSVEVTEHFGELENSLEINTWGKHSTSTVHELFELSKPSVVALRELTYRLDGTKFGSAMDAGPGNSAAGLSAGYINDNQLGFYEGLSGKDEKLYEDQVANTGTDSATSNTSGGEMYENQTTY